MAPGAQNRRAASGRLARAVMAWGTVGGLLVGTLVPTLSEPAPASPVIVADGTPTAAATPAEPDQVVPPGPTPVPSLTTGLALVQPSAAPIDLAVAGQAATWLVRVERGAAAGSGVVVAAEGLIVTSEQVVDGYTPIQVWLPDGRSAFAEILFDEPDGDLALLAVPDATPAVAPLVTGAEAGQPLVLIGVGAGRGDAPVITRAVLVGRYVDPPARLAYRADEALDRVGSGGSVLLNGNGSVVGIATRFGQAGVAVPAERVLAFVKEGQASWRALSRGPAQPARLGQPSLVEQRIEPALVEPGAALTLTYDVLNPGASDLAVVLGASVRPTGGHAWTDDPASDLRVVLQPGRSLHRREFRLPAEAPSGGYEVAWSLLSPDKSASYALATMAGVLRLTRPAGVAAPDPGRAVEIVPQANVVPALVPRRTSVVRQAPAGPPRPAATPAPRARPAVKAAPRPTPVPHGAPSPTPVRRR